jgi:hypothetical protein
MGEFSLSLVKGFIDEPLHLDRIKYLYVHKDNPYFESINNKNPFNWLVQS